MFGKYLFWGALCLVVMQGDSWAATKAAQARQRQQLVRSERDILGAEYRAVLLPSSQCRDNLEASVEKLTDGQITTGYISETGTFPNWIEARWPQPVQADGVRLTIRGKDNLPESVEIQARNLQGKWQQVLRLSDPNDLEGIKNFPATECTAMRLFFGSSPSGKTEIRELEILGSAPRKFLADPTWQGKYIWYPEKGMDNVERFFRREFEVKDPAELIEATLQISADDAWEGFCNAKAFGTGGVPARVIDLKPFLQKGKNLLAFRVQEFSIDEGLLLELHLVYRDGSRSVIVSDEQFKCAKTASADWNTLAFSATDWVAAKPSGRSSGAVAYSPIQFAVSPVEWCGVAMPKTVKLREKMPLTLRFRVPQTLRADYGFRVTLGDISHGQPADYRVAELDVMPPLPTSQWTPGKEYEIPVSLYIPEWAPDGAMPLQVTAITNGELHKLTPPDAQNEVDIQRFATRKKLAQTPVTAQVSLVENSPKLMINGQVTAPFIMFDSGEQDSLHISGTEAQINAPIQRLLVSSVEFYAANEEERQKQMQSLFAVFDQRADLLLRQNQDAWLLVGMALCPPPSWNDRNPDETTQLPDGSRWNHSFSSEKYWLESERGLREFIEHIQKSKFAGRVIGFHFGLGDGPETYYWGHVANGFGTPREKLRMGDVSPAALREFRKWLKERYRNDVEALRSAWKRKTVTFENAAPEIAELQREETAVFRNPATGKMAMDFWTFQSDMMAKTAMRFARTVKAASQNRWICGLWGFYNVSMNHCSAALARSQHIAYTGIGQILDDPNIDYLAGIQGYAGVNLGTPVITIVTSDSLRRHGKLYLEEYDLRTFFTDLSFASSHHFSQFETYQMIKRDFGKALAHDYACWWVGFPNGKDGRRSIGWYSEESLVSLLNYCKVLREATAQYPYHSVAEVGVFFNDRDVVSMDVINADPAMASVRFNFMVNELSKLGVPYEMNSLHDFSAAAIAPYKVVIFADAWYLTAAQRKTIADALAQSGKTVIWFYAPGLVDAEKGINPALVSELANIQVEAHTEPRAGEALKIQLQGRDALVKGLEGMLFQPHTYLYDPRTLTLGPYFTVSDSRAVTLAKYASGNESAIAIKRGKKRTDVYCAIPDMPGELLSRILKEAKVHFYVTEPAYVEAGNRFLSISTFQAGYPEKIQLPKAAVVYDVFAQKAFPGGAITEFAPNIPSFGSAIYFLGSEAEVAALDKALKDRFGTAPAVPDLNTVTANRSPAIAAGNVLEPVEITEWAGAADRLKETQEGSAEEFILDARGSAFLFSAELLPVDSTQTYRLSGKFRQTPGSPSSSFYFGVQCFDKDGQVIKPAEVQVVPQSDTVLIAPVKATDRSIKVKDASHWKAVPVRCAAFDTDDSGKYADLPNRNLSPIGITEIKKCFGGYEVKFSNPVGLARAKGTKVRQHEIAAEYIYCTSGGTKLPEAWQLFSGEIGGEPQSGIHSANHFWRGTKYARIVLLINYAADDSVHAELQEVRLEEKNSHLGNRATQ